LASTVGSDLLGEEFGADVERAVSAALKAVAVFPSDVDALGKVTGSYRDKQTKKGGLSRSPFCLWN